MYNENAYGYLGIVGVIAFLALLALLFRNHDWRAGKAAPARLSDRLWLLGRLNVAALLLASIASFGGLIGIFLRFIRGYNRISPYIAFFALLAAGLWAEWFLRNHRGRGKALFTAVLAVVLAYSYWSSRACSTPSTKKCRRPGIRTPPSWRKWSRPPGRMRSYSSSLYEKL